MVGVAQLVRAPGCGPGGRGFKSHHSPNTSTASLKLNTIPFFLFLYQISI